MASIILPRCSLASSFDKTFESTIYLCMSFCLLDWYFLFWKEIHSHARLSLFDLSF